VKKHIYISVRQAIAHRLQKIETDGRQVVIVMVVALNPKPLRSGRINANLLKILYPEGWLYGR
jgi:hypothetical protein